MMSWLLFTFAPATVAQEAILHNFANDSVDGFQSFSGLVMDSQGNLFGTTLYGGSLNSGGIVFELNPTSDGGWTEKVIHNFNGNAGSVDGFRPYAGLIFDGKGNLYGTTSGGGAHSFGTVFELSAADDGSWTETILYSFGVSSIDGVSPVGSLVFDAKGNLYGTTEYGGENYAGDGGQNGYGTVFELTPSADGDWTEKVLYSFGSTSTDGISPAAGLAIDSSGNLYGTTVLGGLYSNRYSYGGTVFELTLKSGGIWTEQILYNFNPLRSGGDGSFPTANLILDNKGNLYGTTELGGNDDAGTVFELSPASGGGWTEKAFYLYTNSTSGYLPAAGLTMDSQGNLYGTTSAGGIYARTNVPGGTVFELIPQSGGTWTEEILYNFSETATDGNTVYGGIIFDSNGNLYGTTEHGGTHAVGTVYELQAAAAPEFSPGTGKYSTEQIVTISDSIAGATLCYTTDGTTPTSTTSGTCSHGTKYSMHVTVSSNLTVNAIAAATGYITSPVASATYTIQPPAPAATPTFSPAGGSYAAVQFVVLRDMTPAATIYYTTNGTTPTTSSEKYSGPITVSISETIKAFAMATGYANSAIASESYTIVPSPSTELKFIPITTPCRIADTRNADGAFGGPELATQATRTFDVPQSACNIPSTAVAYSLNVTVVPTGVLGFLTIWPAGLAQPTVSTLNSDGRVKANATITPAGTNGGVSVYVSDATQFILDIDGYFVPAGTSASGLEFFPLTPCRVADTRNAAGTLGGPSLTGGAPGRAFPVLSSGCGIPSTAKAYSFNVTAVPQGSLGFLTAWPTGEAQPVVSTLNSPTGTVVANAAIVPAGSGGDISIFVSGTSDVILDVNGYFAPPATGGLSLYTVTPCRALDTRSGSGAFDGLLAVDIEKSACAPPPAARDYVLNATVVPVGTLSYLTLWAAGEAQPDVSTLNADDGAITSNMAIVPTNNGSIDAFASDPTQLILDLSGYFAP